MFGEWVVSVHASAGVGGKWTWREPRARGWCEHDDDDDDDDDGALKPGSVDADGGTGGHTVRLLLSLLVVLLELNKSVPGRDAADGGGRGGIFRIGRGGAMHVY